MSRLPPLLVVGLVVIAGFAPAVTATSTIDAPTAASSDPVVDDRQTVAVDATDDADRTKPPNNTTTRLQLDGPQTGNYSTVTLDFGGSMAMSAEDVENQYYVSLVTVQLDRVSGRAARTAVVEAYLDAAVEELNDISRMEAAATERYRQGEISAETFLVRLATAHVRASAMEESLERVERAAEPLPQATVVRILDLQMELGAHQSRIREHVANTATGELESQPNTIYVTASANGAILEMIENGRYYRNANRFDKREPTGVDQFKGDFGKVQDRLDDIYPWAFKPDSINIIDSYPAQNFYLTTFGHPQGSINAYMDGSTDDVYREEQTLVLDRLPADETITKTTNNTTVRVHRTSANGPFLVNVTRTVPDGEGNTTVEAADALVKIDGSVVGRTGSDGERWMLAPVGDYRITVVRGETTINVSVPS